MELLKTSAEKMGIELSQNQLEKFDLYKKLLLEWNEKMNLTAITDDEGIAIKHFADSISVLPLIENKNASLIDVGTGAGFPGIPLKIANDGFKVTLLDSLNKRITFLEEVKKELGIINLECIHSRAEDGGRNADLREKFDYCVSRAVARLSVLSEYCMPFVAVGGYFISLKGPDAAEELTEAQKAISVLGGKVEKVVEITIPESDLKHCAVVIKKIKSTPKVYPRKAGTAAKKPIV